MSISKISAFALTAFLILSFAAVSAKPVQIPATNPTSSLHNSAPEEKQFEPKGSIESTTPRQPSENYGTAAHDQINSDKQLATLEAQNNLIRQYQSDLLSTVYWSLGVAVGLTLLLAGFGWFTNYKLYESDKAALKESFNNRINEFEAKLKGALDRNKAESLSLIEARLETHATRLATEISSLDERHSKLNEAQQESLSALESRIESTDAKNREIKKEMVSAERNIRLVEQHVWELKDVPHNILLTQTQALRAAVEERQDYYIKHIIERMKDTLTDVFVKRGLKVDKFLFERASAALASAEQVDAAAVAIHEVQNLLKDLRAEPQDSAPAN